MATVMIAIVMGLGVAPVEATSPFTPPGVEGRVVSLEEGKRVEHVAYYYLEPSRKTLEAIAELALDKAIERGGDLARDNAQAIVTYGVAAVTAGTLFASLVGLVVRSLVMAFIRWLFRLRGD